MFDFFNKFYTILLLLSFSSIQLFSQGDVSFVIKNAGFSVNGLFEKVKMEVAFDEKNPSKSRFYGEVETSSVNTDNNKRDKHLRGKDYFNCAAYPTMKFESTAVKVMSSTELSITGKLTIKGVIKEVTLPVEISQLNGKNVFTSTFKLKRRDFGVGGWSLILADDLKVTIKYSY